MAAEVRIDKWLWAARIFKTRSIATDACKKGHVSIGENHLKPSRMVKEGDVITVRKPPFTFSFKILKTIEHRIGPKLIPEILENVTTREQTELNELGKIGKYSGRDKGTGRPTKKDRRDIIDFKEDESNGINDFWSAFDLDENSQDE